MSCAAALLPGAVLACGVNAPRLEPWPSAIDGLWWVRAERGDADARNRGVVSNVLIVRDGRHVWALGSGPSRAFGRVLDCVVHAAADLGAGNAAVRWPERSLRGPSGRLGPLRWWPLQRAPGVPVTVWQVRRSAVLTVQGLLWAGDAPDLRDSRVDAMRAATQQLAAIARGATMLLGEQGEPAGPGELEAHVVYWNALDDAVRSAQSRGDDATTVPTSLSGVDASRTKGTAHAPNWQRAWRHAEDDRLRP